MTLAFDRNMYVIFIRLVVYNLWLKNMSGEGPPKSFYIKLHTTAMCTDW